MASESFPSFADTGAMVDQLASGEYSAKDYKPNTEALSTMIAGAFDTGAKEQAEQWHAAAVEKGFLPAGSCEAYVSSSQNSQKAEKIELDAIFQSAVDKELDPSLEEMTKWPSNEGWPFSDKEYQSFVDGGGESKGEAFFSAFEGSGLEAFVKECNDDLESAETKKDIQGMVAARLASAGARAGDVVMSATDDVEVKLKQIIAEQLGVDIAKVTPDASFTEDLGADSLDAVELIMAIEEAFDIEIPDEEAEKMTTPADCTTAIKGKL